MSGLTMILVSSLHGGPVARQPYFMSRKPKKGYFVRGQFVAEGSELDLEFKRELKGGDAPSKTELKRESAQLQALGEQLLSLRAGLFDPLPLPDKLVDALAEARRITNFEGKRRQMQFIGKLMRLLDEDQLDAIRQALDIQRQGSAADTALLHQAESWRDRMIASDEALEAWLVQHPNTDRQALRALVRQARKDAVVADARAVSEGLAPRQNRAFRELFQFVRAALKGDLGDAESGTEPNETGDGNE